MTFAAQIHPARMRALTPGDRIHRLAALSTELYATQRLSPRDDFRIVTECLARDMKVHSRTVRRWRDGNTVIPGVVLVALGAMLALKRAELDERPS